MGRTVLTDAAVRRMHPPTSGRLVVWDAALPGFGLRITENGKRSWVLTTRLRGAPLYVTLGQWPATGLADARDLAREAIQKVARGEDPRERKRPAADPLAFEEVAALFVEKWAKPRNRTWPETERHFARYVTPHWQGRPLGTITRADVVALLDTIVDENGPIMANRVLASLKKLFAWALNRDLIAAHPAAGLERPAKEQARDRVLTDQELRCLWKACERMGYPWGYAIELLILTAARRGEVEAMAWGEIDATTGVWTIPAERAKVNLPHLIPLSGAARALLAKVPRFEGCGYVFTNRGGKPIRDWSGAMETVTEEAGFNTWRIHDLRRTTRTNLSRLGVASDIAERVLGHKIGGVRAVYDRHDFLAEKRDALERWAAHVQKVVQNVL